MRREPLGACVAGRRPPVKTPRRKSFVTKPEALSVIDQYFDGGAASIAKTKDHTAERILPERFFTLSNQTVYAAAKIRRLDRNQDFHLRRDGQHYEAFPKPCATATTSVAS